MNKKWERVKVKPGGDISLLLSKSTKRAARLDVPHQRHESLINSKHSTNLFFNVLFLTISTIVCGVALLPASVASSYPRTPRSLCSTLSAPRNPTVEAIVIRKLTQRACLPWIVISRLQRLPRRLDRTQNIQRGWTFIYSVYNVEYFSIKIIVCKCQESNLEIFGQTKMMLLLEQRD